MEDTFSSMAIGGVQLDDYPSAKLKVEQFFNQWLLTDGYEFIDVLLEKALLGGKAASSSSSNLASLTPTSGDEITDLISVSSESVLSRPPSSPTKRSPKKRTQSEIYSTSNAGSRGGGSSNGSYVERNFSSSSSSSKMSSSLRGLSISQSPDGLQSLLIDDDTSDSKDGFGLIKHDIQDGSLLGSEGGGLGAGDPRSIKGNIICSSTSTAPSQTASRRRANFDSIPAFFIPGKTRSRLASRRRIEEDQLTHRLAEIEAFFRPFPGGIPCEKFVHVTKRLCGVPSFFNLPLCRRIYSRYGDGEKRRGSVDAEGRAAKSQGASFKIKLKPFLQFWQDEIEPFDAVERFFRVIKSPESDVVTKDDFFPLLKELLHFHPGLYFLESHEEFQRKYALTVIVRIFYRVNTSRSGKISLRELRDSNLLQEFLHVDEETDINKVTEYFSYEHFYVLYCKFFELDTDKDSKLFPKDLLKYAEHSLSEAVVERVFQVATVAFSDNVKGLSQGMSFPDFIFFMIAEEDKGTNQSLQYWFDCSDLDGDGWLTIDELRHFYRSQLHRVTSLGHEPILFSDVLCQMIDMIYPRCDTRLSFDDLKRPATRALSGTLFDCLFNLHKFLRFESRDPFSEKIKREDPFSNDWDRFSHSEYQRLAQEEEYAGAYDHRCQPSTRHPTLSHVALRTDEHGMDVEGKYDWSLDSADDDMTVFTHEQHLRVNGGRQGSGGQGRGHG